MPELLHKLNSTREFYNFIKDVRAAFKALVQAEKSKAINRDMEGLSLEQAKGAASSAEMQDGKVVPTEDKESGNQSVSGPRPLKMKRRKSVAPAVAAKGE